MLNVLLLDLSDDSLIWVSQNIPEWIFLVMDIVGTHSANPSKELRASLSLLQDSSLRCIGAFVSESITCSIGCLSSGKHLQGLVLAIRKRVASVTKTLTSTTSGSPHEKFCIPFSVRGIRLCLGIVCEPLQMNSMGKASSKVFGRREIFIKELTQLLCDLVDSLDKNVINNKSTTVPGYCLGDIFGALGHGLVLEKSHCKVLDTQEIASIPLVKSIGSHFEIACKLLSQWSTDSESKELLEARISCIGYINAAIGFMPWFKNPPRAFGTMLALLLRLMLLELKMEHVDGGISMQKSLTTKCKSSSATASNASTRSIFM